MTINLTAHKTILFQILKDIYKETRISPYLGFKGGTAASLFYGLDRFSIDLDFDLTDTGQADSVHEHLEKIVKKYGTLKESYQKRFNLFYLIAYDDQSRNIKVEINKRQFGSTFEIKTYLGVSMQVMILEDMVAHKLMAMHERIGKTSRDIYDVWFFLQARYPINQAIIENRAGITFPDFIKICIDQLEELDNRHILDGLGEILTPSQKDRVRAKLREETISYLRLLQ